LLSVILSCSHLGIKENRTIDNIFMTRDQNYPYGQTISQMRTTTYTDETILWNRSNHLMGTRSLPSSDDSNNNFSETFLWNFQTEIMDNQNQSMTGTF
jgi:hypothetical protein